jgi:hypothetical protein
MASSNVLTYNQTPPHRPGIDELGGGAFENDPDFPPHPTTEPAAEDFNQTTKQLVAQARMMAAVEFYVVFTAGVPAINTVVGLPDGLVAGDFTVVDNGAGDTSITHTGGKIPPQMYPAPKGLTLVQDVEIDRARAFKITNGWQVKTKLGGTGTDCNFVLIVSGT